MNTNKFIAVKLTFERVGIIILLLFFILFSFLYIKQNNEMVNLKSRISKQQKLIRDLDIRIENVESENSDYEDRINDLESRVDDLESNINY
jgi:cell division protein FtsL